MDQCIIKGLGGVSLVPDVCLLVYLCDLWRMQQEDTILEAESKSVDVCLHFDLLRSWHLEKYIFSIYRLLIVLQQYKWTKKSHSQVLNHELNNSYFESYCCSQVLIWQKMLQYTSLCIPPCTHTCKGFTKGRRRSDGS